MAFLKWGFTIHHMTIKACSRLWFHHPHFIDVHNAGFILLRSDFEHNLWGTSHQSNESHTRIQQMYSMHHEYILHLNNPSGPTKHVSRTLLYASKIIVSFKVGKQAWLLNDKASPTDPLKVLYCKTDMSYFCWVYKATTLPAIRVSGKERGNETASM